MAKGNRRVLKGVVVESKMEKTSVIKVTRSFAHPVYKKYINRSKKYYAHDEHNQCKPGDKVEIIESRPLSKLKRWRVLDIVQATTEV